jgi:hypothetical protein
MRYSLPIRLSLKIKPLLPSFVNIDSFLQWFHLHLFPGNEQQSPTQSCSTDAYRPREAKKAPCKTQCVSDPPQDLDESIALSCVLKLLSCLLGKGTGFRSRGNAENHSRSWFGSKRAIFCEIGSARFKSFLTMAPRLRGFCESARTSLNCQTERSM